MGTLVENKAKSSKSSKSLEIKEERASTKQSKRLTKEYNKIRKHMEELRQAYAAVDSAGETDDIYYRLKRLEKVSKKLRTGGAVSKGAKAHRKILKSLR